MSGFVPPFMQTPPFTRMAAPCQLAARSATCLPARLQFKLLLTPTASWTNTQRTNKRVREFKPPPPPSYLAPERQHPASWQHGEPDVPGLQVRLQAELLVSPKVGGVQVILRELVHLAGKYGVGGIQKEGQLTVLQDSCASDALPPMACLMPQATAREVEHPAGRQAG